MPNDVCDPWLPTAKSIRMTWGSNGVCTRIPTPMSRSKTNGALTYVDQSRRAA